MSSFSAAFQSQNLDFGSYSLMSWKILFFGPVQLDNPDAVGGGESGNRKTIKILRDLGNDVLVLDKPYITSGILSYGWALSRNLLRIIKYALSGYRRIHITGYYLNSIYFEYLVVRLSRLCRLKVAYELRAGGMIEAYGRRSGVYRFVFKKTLQLSDDVLCQGLEYVAFIKEHLAVDSHYYPNFVLGSSIKSNITEGRSQDSLVRLVYFGRVNDSKNIMFLVDVCKALHDHGVAFEMDIIGSYTPQYYHDLATKISSCGLEGLVCVKPAVNFAGLCRLLETKHFFVFPSREKREGHSNSLTEAMAFGVVPVASAQGFNKTVIGCDELIVDEFDANKYANIIRAIWNSGRWQELSRHMHDRIMDNFTESRAIALLKAIYA